MSVRPPDGPLTWNVAGLLADVDRRRPDLSRRRGRARPRRGPRTRPADRWRRPPRADQPRDPRPRPPGDVAQDRVQPVPARHHRPDPDRPARGVPAVARPVATGKPVVDDEEPDVLRLNDHHELELETPVREAIWLAEPIAPLCRPDCPGPVHRLRRPARGRRARSPRRRHRPAVRGVAGVPRGRRVTADGILR